MGFVSYSKSYWQKLNCVFFNRKKSSLTGCKEKKKKKKKRQEKERIDSK